MPTSTEMRTAVYVILAAVRDHEDRMVKRVLAGQAFALAQQAQMCSWADAGEKRPAYRKVHALRCISLLMEPTFGCPWTGSGSMFIPAMRENGNNHGTGEFAASA